MKALLVLATVFWTCILIVQSVENVALQKALINITRFLSQQPYKVTVISDRRCKFFPELVTKAISGLPMMLQTLKSF